MVTTELFNWNVTKCSQQCTEKADFGSLHFWKKNTAKQNRRYKVPSTTIFLYSKLVLLLQELTNGHMCRLTLPELTSSPGSKSRLVLNFLADTENMDTV